MKFCAVVPEICRGQVHALRKERIRIIIIKIKIIIRNGAKTISLQTLFGRLKYVKQTFIIFHVSPLELSRGRVEIPSTGLTLPHFCACPKPGYGF